MPGKIDPHSHDLKSCLLTQLKQIEQADYLFSKLSDQLEGGEIEAGAFQFTADSPGCFSQVTYIKAADSDDLDHFIAVLLQGAEMSFAELESVFGRFNSYPPSPNRIWTAMAVPDQGSLRHPYTLMVRNNAPIEGQTAIREITVRIDRD